MKYQVQLVENAERDIIEIFDYIVLSDSIENADYVYEKIKEKCLDLEGFPHKSHYPPELERIGVTEFREIHFKPYRIIYQVMGNDVFIHCVLDGRRDLQELLEHRLLH